MADEVHLAGPSAGIDVELMSSEEDVDGRAVPPQSDLLLLTYCLDVAGSVGDTFRQGVEDPFDVVGRHEHVDVDVPGTARLLVA